MSPRDLQIEYAFPKIVLEGYRLTSPEDVRYNCIAWAAGISDQFWWPDHLYQFYWPSGAPRSETIDAFIQAYALIGYAPCIDGSYEEGYEKIVIYVDSDDKPTHASRQLSEDEWTSKLGRNKDIAHHMEGLVGNQYGRLARFLKRAVRTIP